MVVVFAVMSPYLARRQERIRGSVPVLRPLVLLVIVALSTRLRIASVSLALLRTGTSAAQRGSIEPANTSSDTNTATRTTVDGLSASGSVTRFARSAASNVDVHVGVRARLSRRVSFKCVLGRGVRLCVAGSMAGG